MALELKVEHEICTKFKLLKSETLIMWDSKIVKKNILTLWIPAT